MAQANDSVLGFPLKGSLRRNPFPKLVRNIARAESTGSLYLLSGQTKKVVFFESGQPVFVRSNVLAECLGQILAQEGLITQEQCDQTLEEIRATGRKQGELLIDKGILSEGNLRYGLETQLRQKFFEIFSWEEGRYQYKAGGDGEDHGLRLEMKSPGLILAALLETCDEERAQSALETVSDRYPYTPSEIDVDTLGLLADEGHYVRCLDGSRTVKELLKEAAGATVPSPKTLVYGLVQAGFAKLSKRARPSREAPPAPDDGRGKPDADYLAAYDATHSLSDLEDTPLPGQLPRRDLGAEDEAVFDGVDGMQSGLTQLPSREPYEHIVSVETDAVDETFEDEIEILDEGALELIDDEGEEGQADQFSPDALTALAREADELVEAEGEGADLYDEESGTASVESVSSDSLDGLESDDDLALDDDDDLLLSDDELDDVELSDDDALDDESLDAGDALEEEELDELDVDDDLMGLDDLDDIELGDEVNDEEAPENAPASEHASYSGAEATTPTDPTEDAEMQAAMRFSEGEMALSMGEWTDAIAHFEAAYEAGFEVAELHAMLALARFRESGNSPDMAAHALELLDYAAELNPKLDLIWGYRSSVLFETGDEDGAREAAQAALDINPYCDVAMEVMDQLG
jgi:hypothetical protein